MTKTETVFGGLEDAFFITGKILKKRKNLARLNEKLRKRAFDTKHEKSILKFGICFENQFKKKDFLDSRMLAIKKKLRKCRC